MSGKGTSMPTNIGDALSTSLEDSKGAMTRQTQALNAVSVLCFSYVCRREMRTSLRLIVCARLP